MNKKTWLLLAALSVMAGAAFAQTNTLDTAIGALKTHIENTLPPGVRVQTACNAPVKTVADDANESE